MEDGECSKQADNAHDFSSTVACMYICYSRGKTLHWSGARGQIKRCLNNNRNNLKYHWFINKCSSLLMDGLPRKKTVNVLEFK